MSYSPRGCDVVDTPTCYFYKPSCVTFWQSSKFQKLTSKLCPYFEIYDHVYSRIGNQINDKVHQLWSKFNSTETHSLYFINKIVLSLQFTLIYDRKNIYIFIDNRAYLNTLFTTFDIGSLFWLKKNRVKVHYTHTHSINKSESIICEY